MPRRRECRQATHEEFLLCQGQFTLDDLLDPTDIADLMVLARQRIIGVWRHERQTQRRRRPSKGERELMRERYAVVELEQIIDDENREIVTDQYLTSPVADEVLTDNYIVGVANTQSSLAWYIHRKMRNYFINNILLRDISMDWILELDDRWRASFVAHLQQKVILLELNTLVEHGDVWYDEARGIWQIRQSVIDEHLNRRDVVRRAVKFDQRPEHGQVRAQRKRRERPSGTSTGEGADSRAIGRASW